MNELGVYREFMTVNVCSKYIKKFNKLLIYGTCVRDEYPHIFQDFSKGRTPLAVCLEKEHINMVGFKLAGLLTRLNVKEVVILTVDGSPHCVQLHFAIEEVEKILGRHINRKHYVIEDGKPIEISKTSVKKARYLSFVEKCIKR
ncbi:MAG: 4Fe-4S ferredoxin [Thermoprotei archaeon]|nr:MAG: 4Fe-4S ferredoxin [Thermoprotei archaeon]